MDPKYFIRNFYTQEDPTPGRPISKESQSNTAAVNSLIDECSNLSCAEIASALSLSKSTVHWILTTVLNYRNVFAVWVPSELTEEQKCQRVKCCKAILDMFRTHPLEYIASHYCVEDESWFIWDAECSWKNWIAKGKNKPQLPRPKLTDRKTMVRGVGMIFFMGGPNSFFWRFAPHQ